MSSKMESSGNMVVLKFHPSMYHKEKNKIEWGYKGTFPYTIELILGLCPYKILETVDIRDESLRKRESNQKKQELQDN